MLFSRIVREDDLIAHASRDWAAIEESKRRRWAEQKGQMSAAEALAVGDALRRHAAIIRLGMTRAYALTSARPKVPHPPRA